MKTERMVLLVTPEEKARIGAEAGKLGVSASEYIRKLVGIIDAEDIGELESLATMMPMLSAAIDNIEANIDSTVAKFEEAERDRAYRGSDAYRDKIRAEVLADPTIDWDAMQAIFGGARDCTDEAA